MSVRWDFNLGLGLCVAAFLQQKSTCGDGFLWAFEPYKCRLIFDCFNLFIDTMDICYLALPGVL